MTEETFTGIGKGAINAYKMPEPEMFGMLMADAIRHGARAYALEIPGDEAEALIWVGLDAERANGGGDMSTIDPGDRL